MENATVGRAVRRAAEHGKAAKVPDHIARIARDLKTPDAVVDAAQAAPPHPSSSRSVWPFAIAAGGAAAVGGGLLALRNSSRKKKTVAKLYVVPTGEVSKAFATRDQNSFGLRSVTARTPKGKFVSHANDLDVFHIQPRRNVTSKLGVYGRGHGRRLS